jgi:DNA-binding GntR family transcriptional regulator
MVEDHGRVVTTNPQAAAWYRRAQQAAEPRWAAMALRGAITADPDFALAAADLAAITGAPGLPPSRRPMNWERHHIELVTAAAAGDITRASDLLREHLASIGCDPLAVRITARLRAANAEDDDFKDLASQLPGCHATPWPRSR